MFTIADARRYAVDAFTQSAVFAGQPRSSCTLDADVLLQYFLQKPRAWLFAHSTADISPVEEAFYRAVERRCTGLPIAYITGEKEFWGLSFSVCPAVLIPKPDTELLVERSLVLIREKAARSDHPISVLDPCTGSGCVIISILHTLCRENIPPVFAVASDISQAALSVARRNAQRLLPPAVQNNLLFLQADMCRLDRLADSLPETRRRFDLIAANPPYVPSALTETLLQDGRSEPVQALDGGADGLDFIKVLANNTPDLLNDKGVLLSEAGEYHAAEAALWFKKSGFCGVHIHKDLAQKDRVIEGMRHDTKN